MSRRVVIGLFGIALEVAVGLFLVILLNSDVATKVDLLKEVAKVALNVIAVGVLGVVLKGILDQYTTDQQEQREKLAHDRALREAQHKARVEALNTLTTGYWQIKKSLHIISAHQSAKSYGEQMRNIIDYRLALQQLDNEISANIYDLDNAEKIGKHLMFMDCHLENLVNEWKVEYLRLSRFQKLDEKIDDPKAKIVPGKIEKLPVLTELTRDRYIILHTDFEGAAELDSGATPS